MLFGSFYPLREPLDLGVPQNMDGEHADEIEKLLNKTYEYMENVVMVESKYDKVRSHCKNKEEDCL